MKLPYELMPFQRQGVDYIKSRKYSLLADDMGLGKTIQSLAACKELDCKRMLIICPASLIIQWKEKIREFYPKIFIEIMGNKPLHARHFKEWAVIASYNRAGTDQGKRILHMQRYDFIILDEMHFLKNPTAKRTKAILGGRIIKNGREDPGSFIPLAKQVCLMSGTPILNRPAEIYTILKSFAPKSLGKYLPWPIFIRRFCGYQGKGAKRTDELEAILSEFLLRRTKEQVLEQLPDLVETVTHVPGIPDPKEDEFIPTRRRLVSLAKLPFIKEYVTDLLETVDKIVLVVYHKETIKKLNEYFKHSVVLEGGMTSNQKQQVINEFKTNPKCKVIIGQISVIGYGIDGLQDVCNYMVFGEIDWSPGILGQAKDRLRRIGQTKTVFIHYLIASNTIEEEIDLKLEWKKQIISELVKPSKGITNGSDSSLSLDSSDKFMDDNHSHSPEYDSGCTVPTPICYYNYNTSRIRKEKQMSEFNQQVGVFIESFADIVARKVVAKLETSPTDHPTGATGASSFTGLTGATGAAGITSAVGISHPDVLPDPETVVTPAPRGRKAKEKESLPPISQDPPPGYTKNTAPVSKEEITTMVNALLNSLSEVGVAKDVSLTYYRETLLKGLNGKKIGDLQGSDLHELRSRLNNLNLKNVINMLLMPAAPEVEEEEEV